jgi:hypothetical protein
MGTYRAGLKATDPVGAVRAGARCAEADTLARQAQAEGRRKTGWSEGNPSLPTRAHRVEN